MSAWKTDAGEVVFSEQKSGGGHPLEIRCGRCIGCRISRSQDWAVRCCHEKKFYDSSVFLTLTWDEERLRKLKKEVPISLDHRPFQLFMKRVRKAREIDHIDVEEFAQARGRGWRRRARRVERLRLSYFMCGEYGTLRQRPHYHALIFGLEFQDRKLFKTNPMPLYRSAELERLWPYGYSSIGDVTMESAQYVAGYIVQKESDPYGDGKWLLNERTGELSQVTPEYGRMSLRPGVGSRFLARYASDVLTRDACVVNGREYRPPSYYDRKLADKMDDNLYERYKTSLSLQADSTPDRLQVQETVVKSRMALKRRILE